MHTYTNISTMLLVTRKASTTGLMRSGINFFTLYFVNKIKGQYKMRIMIPTVYVATTQSSAEKATGVCFLRCDTKQTKAYSSYLTPQKNVYLQANYTVALLLFGIR